MTSIVSVNSEGKALKPNPKIVELEDSDSSSSGTEQSDEESKKEIQTKPCEVRVEDVLGTKSLQRAGRWLGLSSK